MVVDKGQTEQLQSNPFFRLEHRVTDEKKAKELVPKLSAIQDASARNWGRNYEASQQVRRKFREEKRRDQDVRSREEEFIEEMAIVVPLQAEREEDKTLAKNVISGQKPQDKVRTAMRRITKGSIFGNKNV